MIEKEVLWNKNFIIACIANFLTACAFNLLMPTIPLYLAGQLSIEHSKVGIILSSYVLALLIIRPFSGYLVDVYPRKSLYLLGIICFIAVFFGYFFAVTVTFFVLLRFVHGLFWGLSTVSANTVAIDIIPASRRAEGIGYFGVNMNIAMAIAPFFAIKIYEERGFDFLIWVALFMGMLAILVVFFIKVPRRALLTQKRPPISLDRFILIRALPIFLNQLLISFGWGTLAAYAVLYGQETGIQHPAFFFLFLATGMIISRINSGKLVDKGYMHQVIVVGISMAALAFFGFAVLHYTAAFYAAALFIGLGYGSLFPALQTLYVNMAPASKRGTANSTYLTGFDLGIGLGMLIGATVAEKYGFSHMYIMAGSSCLCAVALYWLNSRKVFERHRLR